MPLGLKEREAQQVSIFFPRCKNVSRKFPLATCIYPAGTNPTIYN